MTETRTQRIGNAEVCTIVGPQGQECTARGSEVRGRYVAAYTHTDKRGNVSLRTWTGQTLLGARCEIAGEYRINEFGDKGYALYFRLGRIPGSKKRRYLVGYALALNGWLFRGELEEHDDDDGAAHSAKEEARIWIERDAQDEWEDSQESEDE